MLNDSKVAMQGGPKKDKVPDFGGSFLVSRFFCKILVTQLMGRPFQCHCISEFIKRVASHNNVCPRTTNPQEKRLSNLSFDVIHYPPFSHNMASNDKYHSRVGNMPK